MTRLSEPFVIMAKPVGPACNLECSYCYYLETTKFYQNQHKFRMPDDLLELYIRQYITTSPGPVVVFVWHGGEPTLAGLDFYRRAVELQESLLPEGWTCWNNLQTNGLLLDDEWCSFLASTHFDVGLSIDGTKWLHDTYRKDRHGQGTYESAEKSIRLLQSYGIQPDLLCAVTSGVAKDPLSVYRALKNFNTGWIQFIPIVRHGNDGQISSESVSGEEYGRFLCSVFNEWIHHDLGILDVQNFAELSLVWSGGTANLCWMAPTCGRVLIVEHDGGIYACDHFVSPEYHKGNLKTSLLSKLIDSTDQRKFGNDKRDKLPAQCRNCSWISVCNGECPKNRFILSEDGEPGLNYLCSGLQQFFSHAERPTKKVIEGKKRGLSNEVIMAELRAESLARWKGIGRNDPCPCGSGRKAKQCCWSLRP
ncbi:anaerobic sulfatase maturase [Chloroflexota bacterium]